jgi:hypothetical protein
VFGVGRVDGGSGLWEEIRSSRCGGWRLSVSVWIGIGKPLPSVLLSSLSMS